MIHIQQWSGGPSARITDMTNAGKRGKVCRTFTWNGFRWQGQRDDNPAWYDASDASLQAEVAIRDLTADMNFDAAVAKVRSVMADNPAGESYVRTYEDTIKGIDAPRVKLLAGVADVWSGSADEDGVSLADLTDHHNEPREITSRQSKAEAYRLAAKVWPQVQACRTMSEAGRVLTAAGCKLHYYCAMD